MGPGHLQRDSVPGSNRRSIYQQEVKDWTTKLTFVSRWYLFTNKSKTNFTMHHCLEVGPRNTSSLLERQWRSLNLWDSGITQLMLKKTVPILRSLIVKGQCMQKETQKIPRMRQTLGSQGIHPCVRQYHY